MELPAEPLLERVDRRILKWFKEFLNDRCDVVFKPLPTRGAHHFVCIKEYDDLKAYFQILFSILFDRRRDTILVNAVVETDGKPVYSFYRVFPIEGRFKRRELLRFFDRIWEVIENMARIIENGTLEEYKELEQLFRKFDLNKSSLREIYFERLIPFKRVDFYKYHKLRRILEIRLKHEGREI